MAHTQSEFADNSSSNGEILDYFLATNSFTLKAPYQLRLQHIQCQWDEGKHLSFEEMEKNLLSVVRKLDREETPQLLLLHLTSHAINVSQLDTMPINV
jgi:hypothetical protein